ncbi:hypothetical protein [Enterobacter ludwigii]|uniref:hypothetical protein n=1 Tax=Enterobacter ludwigii TaxID=299767 RepID=UPI00242F934B|nr:hypothetical protein [Enterobacter ludwigii]WFY28176.1 hypothetical protein NFK27_06955 [Enterobacter ludwigii]
MTPHISITLTVSSVSIEKYSELTGLSIDTINVMLADGRLRTWEVPLQVTISLLLDASLEAAA